MAIKYVFTFLDLLLSASVFGLAARNLYNKRWFLFGYQLAVAIWMLFMTGYLFIKC